jgi:pimeloyl-ACP methyl ester carboxylesterase
MGTVINTLAFPAPQLDQQFYEEELLRRPDLVWLYTSDNEKIPAVHITSGDPTAPVLLYSHGNAEDMGLQLDFLDELSAKAKADVFAYEYVGYSTSKLEGKEPSEEACYRSADAAWRYLSEQIKIQPQRIIIYGRSIGSGPAVDLASREKVTNSSASPLNISGVILQSPLESGARAVLGWTTSFVGYYMDPFKNYEKIAKIQCPVAIVHGTADEVVPCQNGRNLYDSLKNPYTPLWLEGYGHNNMPHPRVFEYVKSFVQSCQGRRR